MGKIWYCGITRKESCILFYVNNFNLYAFQVCYWWSCYISKTYTMYDSQWRVTTAPIAVNGRPRALLTSIRNPVVVHFSWSYWLTKITWRCHCHQLSGPAPTPTPNSRFWVSLSLPWPVSSWLCCNMQILFYNDIHIGEK